MIKRYEQPYNGKQFLLNTNTNELHDLNVEKPDCKINEIRKEHIIMFDALDAGLFYQRNNYPYKVNGCAHCLPQYHTG